jgi:hypothetical protein
VPLIPQHAMTRRNYALRRLGAAGVLTPAEVVVYAKTGLELPAGPSPP